MQDDTREPLASGFVTGGGDVARAFTGTFTFDPPESAFGSLVLTTESARDGRVWSTSVQRIRVAVPD